MSSEETSRNKKRDDFTWLVLLLSMGRRKEVPLKSRNSYYRRTPYSGPENYRFKEDAQIAEEQRKKVRRARWVELGYIIFTIAIFVIVSIFVH